MPSFTGNFISQVVVWDFFHQQCLLARFHLRPSGTAVTPEIQKLRMWPDLSSFVIHLICGYLMFILSSVGDVSLIEYVKEVASAVVWESHHFDFLPTVEPDNQTTPPSYPLESMGRSYIFLHFTVKVNRSDGYVCNRKKKFLAAKNANLPGVFFDCRIRCG